MAFAVLPLAFVSRALFHGKGFRRSFAETFKTFARQFPVRTALTALASPLVLAALGLVRLYGAVRHALLPDGDQPDTARREYRQASLALPVAKIPPATGPQDNPVATSRGEESVSA